MSSFYISLVPFWLSGYEGTYIVDEGGLSFEKGGVSLQGAEMVFGGHPWTPEVVFDGEVVAVGIVGVHFFDYFYTYRRRNSIKSYFNLRFI